ncbi:hypothetical protein SADUNF_Sadunf08G0086800 [Salix dunnii]|uniref:Uncharacterized protein n=1 Tax=Salix dunnii TaxID=1413687 RepID=A0A835K1U9_9ROSI|nr:hypothetical protein SADUNF_Sadunf08G0086800 [Salix dunnii]
MLTSRMRNLNASQFSFYETRLILVMLPRKRNCVTTKVFQTSTLAKGKVNLDAEDVRPIEVFGCSIARKTGKCCWF